MSNNCQPPKGFTLCRTRASYDWQTLFNGEAHILGVSASTTLDSLLKNVKNQAAQQGVEIVLAVSEDGAQVWLQASKEAPKAPEQAQSDKAPKVSAKPKTLVARKRAK